MTTHASPRGGHPAYGDRDRERWVAEDPATKRADRDDFARDRARLIHCAAWRRLAGKTQVLGAGADDFVRNRLTHSLEVAQIGREFGAALGCAADVVDTACLAHDLGHPPFGHNGERALHLLAADIGGFEGNAQTLRLLTRLEAKRTDADGRSVGLNLTRASIDAATKYPWLPGNAPRETAKYGAYAVDAPALAWVRDGAPPARPCLEAQVMDWSDDVAYSVHDVEDAIASGRLDPRALRDADDVAQVLALAHRLYAPHLSLDALGEALERLVQTGLLPGSYDGSRPALARLKDMTSQLIGRFVAPVEERTRDAFGGGPLTRFAAELVVPVETRAECEVLKATAAHFVMRAEDRLATQAVERDVITILVTALRADASRLDPVLAQDFAAAPDDDARLRVIIDQVASLTDARAYALAHEWSA